MMQLRKTRVRIPLSPQIKTILGITGFDYVKDKYESRKTITGNIYNIVDYTHVA